MLAKTCNIMLRQKCIPICTRNWNLNSYQCVRLQNTAISAENMPEIQTDSPYARPFNEMPTASSFQIFKALLPGGKFYKKSLTDMTDIIQKEYGDIFYFPKIMGKPGAVFTHNPDDFETVFRNEGTWPDRAAFEILAYHRQIHQADFFKGVEGLVTTRDQKWGQFRSIVNPVLMQPKNMRLYLPRISQVSNEFVDRIKKIRDPQTNEMPANFEEEINRYALESVSVVAMNKHLGLLRSGQVDPMIEQLFCGLKDFIISSSDMDVKPSVWKVLATPKFKRTMKSLDNILEATTYYINEAIKNIEKDKANGIEKSESEKSVLEKLIETDRKIAIVMAMDMMIGGVDTTTSMLTSVLLCLTKNPEKQAKLREEICQALPLKDSPFTESSFNNVPYLKACIKEAIRLYPITSGTMRIIQNEVVLSGYKVPKGVQVFMLANNANMDDKHFLRSQEFLPERWLRYSKEENAKGCANSMKSNNPFVYLPFGFGPRSCIGKRIAEMEVELVISHIIRNFNIAYNYPMEMPFKSHFINVPNIPLKFQFTDLE